MEKDVLPSGHFDARPCEGIALLRPGEDTIDLWMASVAQARAHEAWPRYSELLSAEERERWQNLRFEQDRCRFLLTRALLRSALSRYYPGAPAEWRLEATPFGRPLLVNAPAFTAQVDFNLSHTRDMVVLSVGGGGPIGVDVECIDRPMPCRVADGALSPSERLAMRTLPADRRPLRFYELWTLKEAYLKARGEGLRLPPNRFEFNLASAGRIAFRDCRDVAARDDPAPSFWQLMLASNHVASICSLNGARATLALRRVVPLAFEEVLPLTVSRTS